MAQFGKWLGGGLGWAFGGPIGAIVGFAIGSMLDNSSVSVSRQAQTRSGDFSASLLVLAAVVMKADNRVMKSELDYVKQFFVKQLGVEKTKEHMQLLKEIIHQQIPLEEVCAQIYHQMEHSHRLLLLQFLFGISYADGEIHSQEIDIIHFIAKQLAISEKDFLSIKAIYIKDNESDYVILEIDKSVSNEEVKNAYRRMAIKYHPDKVSTLGEDFQKTAKEKFQKVNQAYENIKKERGMV